MIQLIISLMLLKILQVCFCKLFQLKIKNLFTSFLFHQDNYCDNEANTVEQTGQKLNCEEINLQNNHLQQEIECLNNKLKEAGIRNQELEKELQLNKEKQAKILKEFTLLNQAHYALFSSSKDINQKLNLVVVQNKELENELMTVNSRVNKSNKQIKDKTNIIEELNEKIKNINQKNESIKNQYKMEKEKWFKKVQELLSIVKKLREVITKNNENLNEKEKVIETVQMDLRKQIEIKDKLIEDHIANNRETVKENDNLKKLYYQQTEHLKKFEEHYYKKKELYESNEASSAVLVKKIDDYKTENTQLKNDLKELNVEVTSKGQKYDELNERYENLIVENRANLNLIDYLKQKHNQRQQNYSFRNQTPNFFNPKAQLVAIDANRRRSSDIVQSFSLKVVK
jgi:chromosome segregation ATPase